MTRGRIGLLAAGVVVALAAAVLVVVVFVGGGHRESVTYRFVIPAGTGDRIAAGEEVELVPARLDVHVRQAVGVRGDAISRAVPDHHGAARAEGR